MEIVRNGEAGFIGTSYNIDNASAVFFQRARGTPAPSGVLAGDSLGYFGAGGYATTHFGDGVGVMAVVAMENWTDTAQGTAVAFANTPLGTTDFVVGSGDSADGNVGLGTPGDANGIPTATDKLQVYGDLRVGAGSNGCVKNFAGTQIAGHVRVRPPLQEEHHAVRFGPAAADRAATGQLSSGARWNFPNVISATRRPTA